MKSSHKKLWTGWSLVLTCRCGPGIGITDLNTLNPDIVKRSFSFGSNRSTEKPTSPFLAAVVASMPNEIVLTPVTAYTRNPSTFGDLNLMTFSSGAGNCCADAGLVH